MPQSFQRLTEPIYVTSKVIHGFGRGSKKLGVPTANLENEAIKNIRLESGIYYGFVQIVHPSDSSLPKFTESHCSVTLETNPFNPIYPAVFSFGYNPHFDDVKQRTLEAHVLHSFDYDFYDSIIKVAICGYIRPERKFNSLQELIDTIHDDIAFTKEAVKFPKQNWSEVIMNPFFHVC